MSGNIMAIKNTIYQESVGYSYKLQTFVRRLLHVNFVFCSIYYEIVYLPALHQAANHYRTIDIHGLDECIVMVKIVSISFYVSSDPIRNCSISEIETVYAVYISGWRQAVYIVIDWPMV